MKIYDEENEAFNVKNGVKEVAKPHQSCITPSTWKSCDLSLKVLGGSELNLRFAADAAIVADSKTTLQLLMTNAQKKCKDYGKEINNKENKTKVRVTP